MMIYNFRIDRWQNIGLVLNRLNSEKVLSQGWGGGSEHDLNINRDDFVSRCREHHKLATTRVPSNLLRIRDLKRGDILVTPHLPEYGKVSIHVVADDFPACYEYDASDETCQNHRIRIERSYGLNGKISIRSQDLIGWYGKLPWIRLPVIPIPKFIGDFVSIMKKIDDNPDAFFGETDIDKYMEKLRDDARYFMKESLRKIRPSGSGVSFESICERLLLSSGYKVKRRNQFDSKGGDIDIECVRKRLEWSVFEVGECDDVTLFVQVKKYEGETSGHAVDQIVRMMKDRPSARGCVMSLGDKFSEEAKNLAEDNGVLLMNGDTICDLLLMEMVNTSKLD